ncbi:hypothetical protein [Piscirickettsia salmonis]|nr:hypothetical protein [Piscirickettsia salmonis]
MNMNSLLSVALQMTEGVIYPWHSLACTKISTSHCAYSKTLN